MMSRETWLQDIFGVSQKRSFRQTVDERIVLCSQILISLIILIAFREDHLPHAPISQAALVKMHQAAIGDKALVLIVALL